MLDDDLTAKARIRNAALELYARHGAGAVSLRTIAAEAGVTLGLVQHHFKTKAGLGEAVDQLVAERFAATLGQVRPDATVADRDEAVREMLRANPTVVDYVRRALLDPTAEQLHLLDVLIALTQREVGALREAGRASTKRRESTQIVTVLVRQMGELLLQPMVDAIWERVGQSGEKHKPRLRVSTEEP